MTIMRKIAKWWVGSDRPVKPGIQFALKFQKQFEK